MAVKRSSVSRQGTATREIVVVGGVRTPMGKFGGYFAQLTAVDLAVMAIRELMARTPVSTDALDAVIIGNVIQPAEAPNVARVIALTAGVPRRVPAHTVHRNCASGMQAVTDAAEKILAGRAEVVSAMRSWRRSGTARDDPKTATARPSSASRPKPSTNSAWIRITRQGSVCTQSLGPRRSSNR